MQKPIDRKLHSKPLQKLPTNQLRKSPTPPKVDLKGALGKHLAPLQPVRDASGETNEAATLIKGLHRSGGQPLLRKASK
jgi:hypothetical protein